MVEESGASYTITSTDERSALLFMINLNVVGTLISIAGLTGLIFIGNRYYDELKSVSK
ncbi:conserved domain protein [Turicibacter sanguinis PC909]|uniref:Conserved domain protein n=1 Tax=Turicibacter sanguinis PC909 TaxID=702450 RepID=A0ABP2I9K8_9FIRM|nr:conserved domain protein [Turicibacter sanguinis PC909]